MKITITKTERPLPIGGRQLLTFTAVLPDGRPIPNLTLLNTDDRRHIEDTRLSPDENAAVVDAASRCFDAMTAALGRD